MLKTNLAYFGDSGVLGWLTGYARCREDFWTFWECTGEVAISFIATVERSSGKKKNVFNCSSLNIHSEEHLINEKCNDLDPFLDTNRFYLLKVWVQLVEGCAPVVELHLKAV